MSSSSRPPLRNVPPPAGGKAATPYARFIPREELGEFAAWKPGTLGEPAAPAPGAAPAAAEPSADEWRAQVAAARQAGYQDGYRDGLAALESFKQSFAKQATDQVGALLKSFDAQLARLDEELAGAVARTAVQMARQVLRAEIAARPGLVAQVAAEAVNGVLLSARHIRVQVHPQDLPLVAEGADEALKARGARLVANAAIERGGVLVESDVGAVDARIAERWAQAAAAMGHDEPWDAAG